MIRRIALVAPPWYPVPPRGYGGIELVVDLLARELRALGHEVVLFAAEDSAAASHPICVRDWAAYLGGPQERVPLIWSEKVQGDFLAEAFPDERRGHRQHLAHPGPSGGALVTDHDHVARVDRARRHRCHRVLF